MLRGVIGPSYLPTIILILGALFGRAMIEYEK